MPSTIRIGHKVSGAVGPLLGTVKSPDDNGKKQRQKRLWLDGVVLGAASRGKWYVLWDNADGVDEVSGTWLQAVGPSSIMSDELRQLRSRFNIGTTTQQQAASSTPSASANGASEGQTAVANHAKGQTAVANHATNPMGASTQQADRNEADDDDSSDAPDAPPDADNNTNYDVDALPYEDDTNLQFNTLAMDDNDAAQHNARLATYMEEKEDLMGAEVVIGSGHNKIVWKVRGDVNFDEVDKELLQEFEKVGVRGFDFAKTDQTTKRLNLLELMIYLWPGDWRVQLNWINN